jgi:putative endonuclease
MTAETASTPPRLPSGERRAVLGRRGEALAALHMHGLGFSLLARNLRTRHGEIDLIVFDGRTLAFVEVKTRRVAARGVRPRPDQDPLAGLGLAQRARLRRLACAWLSGGTGPRPRAAVIRFDAIGVTLDGRGNLVRLEHIEGAW